MKKILGFTLTELIITVSIVIILTSISVPLYKGNVNKARIAEGYALLGAIRDSQVTYFNEYRNFLESWNSSAGSVSGNTCNDEVLGINARTNKYYTAFCVNICESNNAKFQFKPRVLGTQGAPNLTMIYNITNGTTVI